MQVDIFYRMSEMDFSQIYLLILGSKFIKVCKGFVCACWWLLMGIKVMGQKVKMMQVQFDAASGVCWTKGCLWVKQLKSRPKS